MPGPKPKIMPNTQKRNMKMDWDQAQNKIKANIKVETNIDTPESNYRLIKEVNDKDGFKIQIGKSNNIKIPWSMLKQCFYVLVTPDGYDGNFFRKRFPGRKGCYVHSIGQIFVEAGIAKAEDKHKYRIRKALPKTK